ncbi:MAG TPA: neutral/alkaline non-lysosomal ceramidase N-terminal domain-containing protein [Anaeromyxobacteraceae bacterium]|nr:neutral/alkaline non-lysosomal ceramidase N-terminal domain-containing protein [Anaeromyxobacteraceae bacterium]
MKKLLTRAAVLVGLLLAAVAAILGAGSLRWRPTERAGAARPVRAAAGDGPLLAGVAELPLSPEPGAPVAGFPRLHWSSAGVRDPLAVRAVVLSEPGCQVALVSAELLLVPGELSRAVEARVRDLGLDAVVVAATHTHSGPGGFWDNLVAEGLATGPYHRRAFEALADRIAAAVRAASAAREPALLSVARADAPELIHSREYLRQVAARLTGFRLTRPSGALLAQLLVYPSHATLLGPDNHLLSGDWPGALMRAQPVPTLFFQGALGDATPHLADQARLTPEVYARAVEARVSRLAFSPPDPRPALALSSVRIPLPPPDPAAAPPRLQQLARNMAWSVFPAEAVLTALRLGPLALLFNPGEPVMEVGEQWRAQAGPDAEVVSLAGDYVGYVETPERMALRHGETERTYYGPGLAGRLGEAVAAAWRALPVARGR